jgi:hypothetical protein
MRLVSVYGVSERLLDWNGQYDINKVQEIKKAVAKNDSLKLRNSKSTISCPTFLF